MKDIQYLVDRLTPELQYIGNDEELVYLYLKNDEGLTGKVLDSLLNVMMAELSFYVNKTTDTKGGIEPIAVPVEVRGKTDLIILIKKEQLKGIKVKDELEGAEYTKESFPINKFKEDNKEVKLQVINQYEGKKKDVLSFLGNQWKPVF